MMPIIDLSFPIQGTEITADHNYFLYGAISEILPELHNSSKDNDNKANQHWSTLRVHPIRGNLIGNRKLAITKYSYLTIRCDHEIIRPLMKLAGCDLLIGRDSIRVGIPTPWVLKPFKTLVSRLVIIKGYTEPENFLDAVSRQLANLNIVGIPELVKRQAEHPLEGNAGAHLEKDSFLRRTIRIGNYEIVGYSVLVKALSDVDSILLQETGIGGKGHFGCGVFIPVSSEGED